jgi:hypothetical protein
VTGALLQRAAPFPFLPGALAAPLGAALLAAGITLNLAFSLIHVGIASWANSVWLLATLVGAVALIHHVVIQREERYLERRFGAEYLAYKASVRRWL